MSDSLKGKVAVVTGASRGIGKGIALALGEAGATVYVSGRTGAGHAATVPLAGTVDDTAREVSDRGGVGIAVRCDHRDDTQTEALFERVKSDQGRIDLLANVAWAGYEGLHDGSDFPLDQPFWARRLSYWDDNMFGLRAAYIASVFAARMMVEQKHGLIANISSFIKDAGSPPYPGAKTGTDRLALDMAHDLRPHHVAAVSLWPGLVRTEGILLHEKYIDLSNSESPEFTGRAVVALANDPDVLQKSGRGLWVSDLAAEYGFTDIDGKVYVPTWYASEVVSR